jgi:hypothetical protein
MDELLTQLGVGGIFALLIIREVLGFLSKRKERGNGNGNGNGKPAMTAAVQSDLFQLLREINEGTKELVRLHDVKDEDGVPVWYVRKSLERQIEQLVTGVAQLTSAIAQQVKALEGLSGP